MSREINNVRHYECENCLRIYHDEEEADECNCSNAISTLCECGCVNNKTAHQYCATGCQKFKEETKSEINSQETNSNSAEAVKTIESSPDTHSKNKELMDKDYDGRIGRTSNRFVNTTNKVGEKK